MDSLNCTRFSGGDWPQWLQLFNAYALLKNWDAANKLVALPLFLDESVRPAFNALPDADRNEWDRCVQQLGITFQTDGRDKEQLFKARCKRETETFATFAAALTALSLEAFPDHSLVTRERLCVQQFLKGLPIAVAEEAARKNPGNLTEAVNASKAAVNIRHAIAEIRGSEEVATKNVSFCAVNRSTSEIEELRQEVKELTTLVRELAVKAPSRENVSERPWRNRTPTPTRRDIDKEEREGRRERSVSPARQIKCFACQGYGHMARECTTRRPFTNYTGAVKKYDSRSGN